MQKSFGHSKKAPRQPSMSKASKYQVGQSQPGTKKGGKGYKGK